MMGLFDLALKVKAKNGILQKFIDDKGWSQSDFAREVGGPPSTVGQWFNMRDYPKSDDLMNRVCSLVNKPPEKIFPVFLRDVEIRNSEREWIIYKKINLDFLPLHDLKALPAPEKECNGSEMRSELMKSLTILSQREERVIKARFGLESDEQTFEALGKEFGVSRGRIQQIETKALKKLRGVTGLREFVGL